MQQYGQCCLELGGNDDVWSERKQTLLCNMLNSTNIVPIIIPENCTNVPQCCCVDVFDTEIYYAIASVADMERANVIKQDIGYYYSNNPDRRCSNCRYFQYMKNDQCAAVCGKHVFGMFGTQMCCIQSYCRQSDVVDVDKEFKVCLAFATAQGIELNLDHYTKTEAIIYVTQKAKEQYLKENYPVGSMRVLDYSICSCRHYKTGNKTCECGKQELSTVVFGNLLNGFEVDVIPTALAIQQNLTDDK